MFKLPKYAFPYFVLLTLVLSVHANSFSQNTIVSGKIVDAITREPLPFVNVIFKGTTVGGTTDFEGYYTISTSQKVDSIIVSFVGYNRLVSKVNGGATQQLNLSLSQGVSLLTVEVIAGENPAHRIVRNIIANKKKNNSENLDAYQYEVYNKVEFDLNNISENFKKRKLLKPFSFIFDNIDSTTNAEEKPYLPVFMTESLSDFHYRKNPKTRNEVIKASKVAGIENTSVSQFMGDMYQKVNVYNNSIVIFLKNFTSPISDNALLFYKFYLIDSMEIDGHRCYQLQIKPKRKQQLAFVGNIWVTDSAFAVKQLELSIVDDANINFINSTAIVQTYNQFDGAWMLEKERIVIDFNPFPIEKKKQRMMGIYGRKTASYKNFKINSPKENDFYSLTENLKVNEDAFEQTKAFWTTNRHDSLSNNEKEVYRLVDTLQSLPVYRTWIDVIQLFVTGYKVKGNFEYGPYYSLYSFNPIEGNRFRFGGRTSNAFSKMYELSGYVAYGTLDEKFKYRLGIRAFVDKTPRTMVGMHIKNDNEILGQSQNGFKADNILSSLFRITPLRNLTNVKEVNAYVDRQWFSGFSTKLSLYNRKMSPLGDFQYEYNSSQGIQFKESITTSEVRFLTRFAYNEKFLSGVFDRTSLGTKYPILQAQYTLGVKDLFRGEYNYQKLGVNLSHRIRINPIGHLDYMLEYGKIWGLLPYPVLSLPGGNETYIYDPFAYNSMNYYEFATDEYASLSLSHHFGGFFFNRIPLMRKLKWREVVGGKALIGRVSGKNQQLLIFPDYLKQLNDGPYFEATAGIENILKIFRVDAIWRLSYLDSPKAIPFTIKASLQFTF